MFRKHESLFCLQDHKDFLPILLFLVLKYVSCLPEVEKITKMFLPVILRYSSDFSLLKLETKKWIWIYKSGNAYPLPISSASRSNKRKIFTFSVLFRPSNAKFLLCLHEFRSENIIAKSRNLSYFFPYTLLFILFSISLMSLHICFARMYIVLWTFNSLNLE